MKARKEETQAAWDVLILKIVPKFNVTKTAQASFKDVLKNINKIQIATEEHNRWVKLKGLKITMLCDSNIHDVPEHQFNGSSMGGVASIKFPWSYTQRHICAFYLNHSAVNSNVGADVDIGGGRGPLSLWQSASWRWVAYAVVESMRCRMPVLGTEI